MRVGAEELYLDKKGERASVRFISDYRDRVRSAGTVSIERISPIWAHAHAVHTARIIFFRLAPIFKRFTLIKRRICIVYIDLGIN